MFFNQYCTNNTDVYRRNKKSDSYFLQLVHDENRRVNELKEQEKLATAENPRIKDQEESSDICKELREFKLRDILEQKRRQQLRANNHDLRELQKQLQTALVSKQLSEQRNLNAKQKKEELLNNREESKKRFVAESEIARNLSLQEEGKKKQERVIFRSILKGQINDLQQRRRTEFENVMKDREEMQKLIKRIEANENAERKEALLLREKCKREMEESYRNKELQRQLEREQNDDDIEKSLAYQKKCDDLNANIIAQRKSIQMNKDALSERLGQQLANINNEKQKRESLLLSLLVEERKAKEDERYRHTLEKQIKGRKQMRDELEHYQQEVQVQRERQFKMEEQEMHEEHMRYLAERDKLDQLSDEKRRRKRVEHNKALKEMIEVRRRQRADAISKRIADFEKMLNDEKERDQQIEEERMRLLINIPKELLSYLPPGVLRASDKDFLDIPCQKT